MPACFQTIVDWMEAHPGVVWSLIALSVVTFIGSLILVPYLVVRMREDYFMPHRLKEKSFAGHHPVLRWVGLIGKNLLGVVLFAAGIAMIFLPGQGLLTILAGLCLMNFPGKHRFLIWIIRRKQIHRGIDWLRRRKGRSPIQVPGEAEATTG